MSIETWKAEFYPVPADDKSLDTDVKRVEHSLRKWEGLTPGNIEKHELEFGKYPFYTRRLMSISGTGNTFFIDDESCALCEKHFDTQSKCSTCPLAIHLGDVCDGDNMPYSDVLSDRNR